MTGKKSGTMSKLKIKKPLYLCHYTSVDVLCKLFTEIKNDEFLFHASSVVFMNDSAEYMAARKHCRDGVEEMLMEEITGMPFALCFSEREDIIPMWNMYAKEGKGACLMFDYDKLKEHFNKLCNGENEVYNYAVFSSCRYQEVDYKKDLEKPLSLEMEYPDTDRYRKAMTEDAFIKPLSFKYENEWRFMVWQKWHPSLKRRILFKVRNEELCPFIIIPIPVNCLKRIVLSPSASGQMIDSTSLLRANYAAGHMINVEKSILTLKV